MSWWLLKPRNGLFRDNLRKVRPRPDKDPTCRRRKTDLSKQDGDVLCRHDRRRNDVEEMVQEVLLGDVLREKHYSLLIARRNIADKGGVRSRELQVQ